MEFKVFESTDANVFKYVFSDNDYVAESVLYRYGSFEERTVICCSTQSGCPVGCKFCGTGNKFIRNLSSEEIVNQVKMVIGDKLIDTNNVKKFQIMFMSMGEPMLNWDNVEEAIIKLNELFPNADLLLSTIAPRRDKYFNRLINLSMKIKKVGLQFSIHKSNDADRNELIPFENKYTLREIRDYGILWWKSTGRHPYLNYCIDGSNNKVEDAEKLFNLFSPMVFNFTFSVVCSADENMKEVGYKNLEEIKEFEKSFLENGYNTRVFNPAGQDDIGGGCGQLWYVQQWIANYDLKEKSNEIHKSKI